MDKKKQYRMEMYSLYAKLRDDRSFNDAQVSNETGIGRSTFSDWKVGRSAPKIEKLLKIADLFKVSLGEFVP